MPTLRDVLASQGVPLKGYQAPGLASGEPTPGEFQNWFAQQGPPPGAAPGTATPTGPASSDELLAYFDSLRQGLTPNSASLLSLEPQLAARGIKVLKNAMGIAGKIQLPSGEIVDVGGAFSSGNQGQMSWQTLRDDRRFNPSAGGMQGALEMAPGYQFRLGEGAKALERSAAARGTLLTGGTLKGLERYAQGFASNEYQNRYNQLSGLANIGANAAGAQAGQNTSYANQAGDLMTQQGNAAAAGTVGSANAWNQGIGNAANIAQQYYFARLYGTQPPGTSTPPYVPGATVPIASGVPTGLPGSVPLPGSLGWMSGFIKPVNPPGYPR